MLLNIYEIKNKDVKITILKTNKHSRDEGVISCQTLKLFPYNKNNNT